MIERWHNKEHKTNKEIADLLNKSERTIRREIKRGLTTNITTYYEEIEVYSADISNDEYKANMKAKGQELKIGSNIEIINQIEKMIKEEKKSPEVIAYELKEKGLLEITARTIRNYIYDGNVFDLKEEDMIYNKKHKSKNKDRRIAKHTPPEKSIENRPQEANDRSEYGHWEGDLIIGKRKKGWVLLTFTERMTREEIIIKIKGKNNEYVVKAINGLERKYGKRFYNKFKTITFDNGVEFMDYEGMEQSCIRKGKRTQIYYAHPYCSGERGTNENNNRMIRRWIPKGIAIDNISKEFIKKIEEWLNNYPRAMFDYKSSNMLLLEI
ncbi:MAG: IS30 family transposase [Spirochaetales bacterium]|nr:IS30 family transposase [Spirochaetales bacterium]